MDAHQIFENFQKHLQRADLLIDVARWREALHELNQHLASYPDSYQALCQAALCHYRLKEYQKGYDTIKIAIANSPEQEWAYRLQSLIFTANGEHRRALEAAETCIEKAPNTFAALQTLFYAEANYGLLDKAKSTLPLLLRSSPDSMEAHVASGYLALKTDDLSAAERGFLEALKIDANCVNALNNLGVVYLERSKRSTARQAKKYRKKSVEMFERAVKAEPTFVTAQKNIKLAGLPTTARVGITGGLLALALYLAIPIVQNMLYAAAQSDFSSIYPVLSVLSPYSSSYVLLFGNILTIWLFVLIAALLIGAYFSYDYREKILERLLDSTGWFVVILNICFPLILYSYAGWNGEEFTVFSWIAVRILLTSLFLAVLRWVLLIQLNRSHR